MTKRALSTEQYKHFGAYERLRQALRAEPEHERLQQPLAFWVLPTDRRLPVAFLDRHLEDILSCSLDELLSTPGVGQKKISGLLTLLKRAQKSSPGDGEFGLGDATSKRRRARVTRSGFDPSVVSEELWAQWRETARRCDMGSYSLGRLTPSLQSLPTVIWHTPLSEYMELTLHRIRNLKTHGAKRVHAILEVFCGVHEALATATMQDHLEIVLQPKFVPPLSKWLIDALGASKCPTADDLNQFIAAPLVQQIEVDLDKQVAKLAAGRVGIRRNSPSVRKQAERMGVTRARVYQLLDDCAKVMDVRWPEGRWLLAPMGTRLALEEDMEALGAFRSICELFFPQTRADEPSRPGIQLVST